MATISNVSDQYSAQPGYFLTSPIVPIAFRNTQPPTVPPAGLSAYQLALADKLVKGTLPPFGVNEEFQAVMNTFASSKLLSPITTNPKTLQPVQPPFAPGVAGNAYVIVGNIIHIVRQAEACGPGEAATYTKVPIENISNVTIRTWQYYGDPQPSGTIAIGTGDGGGI